MKLSVLGLALAILFVSAPLFADDDLESAFAALKQSVDGKKDPADIKKQAMQTHEMAAKIIAAKNEAEVKRAKEIDLYSEYALYTAALAAPPATAVDLFGTLAVQNPKSQYLEDGGYTRYFAAMRRAGEGAKIPATGEKLLAAAPDSGDLLLAMAEASKGEAAIGYAKRAAAAFEKSGKGGAKLGQAHFAAGMAYAQENKYVDADKELRAALPQLKGNQELLWQLGMVNYQLGKMMMKKAQVTEAAKFMQQAAALKGPRAQEAAHNSLAMQAEAARMR